MTRRSCSSGKFYTCIREMLGLNLDRDAGKLDRFSWFSLVPPDKYLDWATTDSFQILSNSSFTNHHIRHYMVQALTMSENNPQKRGQNFISLYCSM
jgi:hypothetical protein